MKSSLLIKHKCITLDLEDRPPKPDRRNHQSPSDHFYRWQIIDIGLLIVSSLVAPHQTLLIVFYKKNRNQIVRIINTTLIIVFSLHQKNSPVQFASLQTVRQLRKLPFMWFRIAWIIVSEKFIQNVNVHLKGPGQT